MLSRYSGTKLESMQLNLNRKHQLQSDESCISSYMTRGLEGSSHGRRDNIVSADVLGNIISGTSQWQANDQFATRVCEPQAAEGGPIRTDKLCGETESFGLPKPDGSSSLQNQSVGTIVFPAVSEHPRPATPMEPMGHPVAWTPHPHPEQNLLGCVQAAGQPLVQQDLQGLHHARMVLPLELAEEPVYVNAKQYHGILRRRQLRAKAELENKVPKVRKPYLHESRHLHAMRRARGCGGRFLSKKKFDGDTRQTTSEVGACSGANANGSTSSQDSELAFTISSENANCASNCNGIENHSMQQGRQNSDLPHWASYRWQSH